MLEPLGDPTDPAGIALFTFERMQNPSLQSIGFTGLFAVFFLFLYITLYTFGHLLLERQANESPTSHVMLNEVKHLQHQKRDSSVATSAPSE